MQSFRSDVSRWILRATVLAALLAIPAAAVAQPFGLWTAFAGDGTLGASNGYLNIPNSPALNPTSAITIEAWVTVNLPLAAQQCRSIVGNDYKASYWVGVCGSGSTAMLRSYMNGEGSILSAGTILNGGLVHIAVTSDGTTRNHYIDGELVGTRPETGPPGSNSAALEIGGDVQWQYSLNGIVNEVRLWNVARTVDEIRSTINVPVRTAQPGLVAVWPMFTPNDALGGHDGTFVGNIPPILGPPAESTCGTSGGQGLCLQGHYAINAAFRQGAPGTASAAATIVNEPNTGSGIFWFFNADDWEIMVKVINGCALNSQWWVFSAATTNVFYQLNVTDVQSGETKIYFNYPGPPAPAVTDTSAFACSG
jgi:hypothetical protein